MVQIPEELSDETAAERAALIFGLQNFSLSHATARDIESIAREAINRASGSNARTFAVRTKREDKRFAMNSVEIDRAVGGEVQEALGFEVDLRAPELTISIEIMNDAAYVSAGKMPGAGGLPVGVTGRGLALLSGGIDSPVAAYRMMRRGLRLDFVHFHAYPIVSAASREKAAELAAHLTRWQARSTLMLVPFGHLQGESLGQVASQTLENMAVIEKAAAFPVMRPLVGMDKNEIIDQARRLRTFETSILPDQDCCTLFMPAHPETRARIEEVVAAESRFDIPRMIDDAVRATEVERFWLPPRAAQAAAARAPETQ